MDNINDTEDKIVDRKELLRAKRELKKLERFMYDRERTLRDSTRKNIKQDNYDIVAKEVHKPTAATPGISSKKTKKIASKSNSTNGKAKKNGSARQSDTLDDIDGSSPGGEVSKNDPSVISALETSNKISMSFSKSFMQIDTSLIAPHMSEDVKSDTAIQERVEKEFPHEVKKYYLQKDNFNENNLGSRTFINCDLRFLNFDLITSRIGYVDVIMLDPPWRIKGGQRNDSSFMFSNSKFNLEYNTLSNNEIISLPVEKLSKKGKDNH
jgi:hypothetical protein